VLKKEAKAQRGFMTATYVKTDTVLDKILAHKVEEVAVNKAQIPLAALEHAIRQALPARDFAAALRRETVALIAEVK
jgi:hypothetical protein